MSGSATTSFPERSSLLWITILRFCRDCEATQPCASRPIRSHVFFEPVPKEHFSKALFDTIAQWNAESDWKGDERNVVLALARIWQEALQLVSLLLRTLSCRTGIGAFACRASGPSSARHAAYLGSEDDDLAMRVEETAAFVRYAKATIERILR